MKMKSEGQQRCVLSGWVSEFGFVRLFFGAELRRAIAFWYSLCSTQCCCERALLFPAVRTFMLTGYVHDEFLQARACCSAQDLESGQRELHGGAETRGEAKERELKKVDVEMRVDVRGSMVSSCGQKKLCMFYAVSAVSVHTSVRNLCCQDAV